MNTEGIPIRLEISKRQNKRIIDKTLSIDFFSGKISVAEKPRKDQSSSQKSFPSRQHFHESEGGTL